MGIEDFKKNDKRLDKVRGSLIGGAVGDALGYAIEFMSEGSIFSKYGDKGITEYERDLDWERKYIYGKWKD